MSDETPLTHANVAVNPCDKTVRALKDWRGEELDDLAFSKGDILVVSKHDGAGWAYATAVDGAVGWFPLECTEEVFDNAVAEVGTATGHSALDAFIKVAQEKPNAALNLHTARLQHPAQRHNSLNDFLATKPMREEVPSVAPSAETTEEIEAAQKRLLKMQKKRQKERAEVLIENLRSNWKPANPFNLTEDQFDRVVSEIVYDIPVGREKYHFSSYDDVFTGSALAQALKSHAHRVTSAWEKGISADEAAALAQNLLERNVIIDVADPARKKFRTKYLYQCRSQLAEYSVLNFDKIYASNESVEGYQLSIALVGEIIELFKKYMPNTERLRRSKELRSFGLRLASLQQVNVDNLNSERKKVFYVNVFNTMMLYAHAKFMAPTNTSDKRMLHEHCSLYTNQKRLSIQDLESEVHKFASKEDPGVYLCISDCTRSTPAIFIFSDTNFEMTQLFAIRHFLNRTLVVDSSNYEITFPKIFQRIWKDLGFEKNQLLALMEPYMAREQREELQRMRTVGEIDMKFHQYDYEPYYVFEEASPLSPRQQ